MKFLLKSQDSDPALRLLDRWIESVVVIITCLVCCSCGSTKVATQLVRDVRTDTVYLRNVQYDSIYISQEHHTDYRKDTILIREVATEYRYKLIRDTLRMVERDSIPYQVTVTEVKEIIRPMTWFDHLTRACFWFIVGGILFAVIRKVRILS